MAMTNKAAAALGKLGKGKPKTITPALRRQRKAAVKARWAAYRARQAQQAAKPQ